MNTIATVTLSIVVLSTTKQFSSISKKNVFVFQKKIFKVQSTENIQNFL